MHFDVARLDAALRPLVGMPAWGLMWAADMLMLQFGPSRQVANRFGPRKGWTKSVGELALHVQCTWEIRGAGVRVGLYDHDVHREPAQQALVGGRRVIAATGDPSGGARIVLDGAVSVAAIPAGWGEWWRLFHPYDDRPHFVVGCNGIEAQGVSP